MKRLIAIGERGTAFAELDDEQMQQINLNGMNPVFEKEPRSKEQKGKRDRNEHHGALWADSRSYVSTAKRQGEFWLGTIDRAIGEKRVWKATVTLQGAAGDETVQGYIRADYDGSVPHARKHKYIAVTTQHGRIEAVPVKRESQIGLRNSPVVRKVLEILKA
jgi:hypothetical protein